MYNHVSLDFSCESNAYKEQCKSVIKFTNCSSILFYQVTRDKIWQSILYFKCFHTPWTNRNLSIYIYIYIIICLCLLIYIYIYMHVATKFTDRFNKRTWADQQITDYQARMALLRGRPLIAHGLYDINRMQVPSVYFHDISCSVCSMPDTGL